MGILFFDTPCRVWANNLMVQAAANAYSRNIEIINEHGRTLTIDARQSIGPNLVITFISENQHCQSTEETSVHFNIKNVDVDRHDKDGDKLNVDADRHEKTVTNKTLTLTRRTKTVTTT